MIMSVTKINLKFRFPKKNWILWKRVHIRNVYTEAMTQ